MKRDEDGEWRMIKGEEISRVERFEGRGRERLSGRLSGGVRPMIKQQRSSVEVIDKLNIPHKSLYIMVPS